MKPDQTGIGLEAAKLLKSVGGIISKYVFVTMNTSLQTEFMPDPIVVSRVSLVRTNMCYYNIGQNYEIHYPAYTWQEVLWEYAKQFFGNKLIESEHHQTPAFIYFAKLILVQLQRQDYEQAEKIFLENCILLKTK